MFNPNQLWQTVRASLSSEQAPEMTERLFRSVCLLCVAATLGVIEPINFLENISPFVHVAVVAFGAVCLFLYRAALRGRYHYRLFFALVLVTLDATWFLNAGADGSGGLLLFGGGFTAVLFFTGRTRILALAVFLLDGVALYLAAGLHPDWIIDYDRAGDLLIDRLIGFTVANLLLTAMVWIVLTAYHRERATLETTVQDLETAITEVRTLRGLLPICAWCKKIRTDRGLWTQVELYMAEHSDLRFTHGVCPDCARRFGGDTARSSPQASDV